MSLFKQKPESTLSDFCTRFYDANYLHPLNGAAGADMVYPNVVKSMAAEGDDVFASISEEDFAHTIQSLEFEVFALAWLHKTGEELAIAQSIFTKEYLYGNDCEYIWDGMERYNNAVAHASKIGLSEMDQARLLRARADAADKWIPVLEKKGIPVDESAGRPINRLGSEAAWKKGNTTYFLILALCHQLGLGSGPSYTGPSKKAQESLGASIKGLYDGVVEQLSEVKITQ